eukprot:2994764-Pleurochrysis_carterae.AAC.3
MKRTHSLGSSFLWTPIVESPRRSRRKKRAVELYLRKRSWCETKSSAEKRLNEDNDDCVQHALHSSMAGR